VTLTRVDGFFVNQSAITNGPAAGMGTYVGTILTNASGACDWNVGSAASGGGRAFFSVWNMYNRVDVSALVVDSAANWTYSTDAWRYANGSSGNRVEFVVGNTDESFYATYACLISSNVSGLGQWTCVGHNDTTTLKGSSGYNNLTSSLAGVAVYSASPAIGRNIVMALERANSGGSATFYGAGANPGRIGAGLTMTTRM
jgi:hypothetical protein